MQRLRAWLSGDLARVRILERDIAVKRVHLTTLLLIVAIAVTVGLLVGFLGGRYAYPYHTTPAPPVPKTETTPQCQNQNPKQHALGSCLPAPKSMVQGGVVKQPTGSIVTLAADISASTEGCDLSNNNPVQSASGWDAIAHKLSFCIFKVNESTGYVDPTARPMAAFARARHLAVGGYDFLHICLVDPVAEAHVFVAAFRGNIGTGPGTLPPVGDAEYPPSPQCNVRAWLTSWAGAVHAGLGRWPWFYTGAWWWNPHVGAFWPANALAWVSGYTGSLGSVPLPSGRSHIDLWQFSDHGFNGATSADASLWEDGVSAFRAAAGAGSPPKPRTVCWGKGSTPASSACKAIEAQAKHDWTQYQAFHKALLSHQSQARKVKGVIFSLQKNGASVYQTYKGPGLGWYLAREKPEVYYGKINKARHDALVKAHHA